MEDATVLGNGHDPEAPESSESNEELGIIRKKLNDFKRGDAPILSFSKQQIGLLNKFVNPPEQSDDFVRIVQICDFLDEDERNRELEAYYEAVRLGMSTSYNVAHALSCASINRKGAHRNSRVASILDALSHQKLTSNVPRGNNANTSGKSSPIA
jgi:hypothetical protein